MHSESLAHRHVSVVDEAHDGARLDMFLSTALKGWSRAGIQRLIREGHVRLNGRAVKAHHAVRRGDNIETSVPAPRVPELLPEPIPLEVLHEDGDLLVVNKAAGMVVHPAGRNMRGTLVNALLARCGNLSAVGGVLKPGIVHRLDKGTTGCIAVAKNDETHRGLCSQFLHRQVHKEYLALVHGVVRRESGLVEGLIARHPADRKRMAVRKDRGRNAVTSFQVLERFDACTLVTLRLHTGRTHQIRVHMAHLGHPVVGDSVYGKNRPRAIGGLAIERPMLHAFRLGFTHPRTGDEVRTEAPLPGDMARLLDHLRARKGKVGA